MFKPRLDGPHSICQKQPREGSHLNESEAPMLSLKSTPGFHQEKAVSSKQLLPAH